jgi:HD-GYP domain-containing protein (c-di-GMP phosphodiesterase class II)
LGCTAVADPLSYLFGDEIEAHRRGARFVTPLDPVLEIVRRAGAGLPVIERVGVVTRGLRGGPGALFAGTCEAAGELANRLGYPKTVASALSLTFARYDGKGWPRGAGGDALPVPIRVVQAAEDTTSLIEIFGIDSVADQLAARAGRQLDPLVVGAVRRVIADVHAGLECGDAWTLLHDADPDPSREITDEQVDEMLLVAADLVDLKVPARAGHSRRVAALSGAAARTLGTDARLARQAALLHAIGTLSVSNDVWARQGRWSSVDRERIRLAPYHTDRICSRATWLAPPGKIASQYAERLDGSGYYRGQSGSAVARPARILQACDRYDALARTAPKGSTHAPREAATRLRAEASAGKFDAEVVEAVIGGAGGPAKARRAYPDRLTAREIEVLTLLAHGQSSKAIAETMVVSPRTVGHHIAHIYDKIGVTTRAGATLYAMRAGLLET